MPILALRRSFRSPPAITLQPVQLYDPLAHLFGISTGFILRITCPKKGVPDLFVRKSGQPLPDPSGVSARDVMGDLLHMRAIDVIRGRHSQQQRRAAVQYQSDARWGDLIEGL